MLLSYNQPYRVFNRAAVSGDSDEKYSGLALLVESVAHLLYQTEIRIFVWIALIMLEISVIRYIVNHSPQAVAENKAEITKVLILIAFVVTGGLMFLFEFILKTFSLS